MCRRPHNNSSARRWDYDGWRKGPRALDAYRMQLSLSRSLCWRPCCPVVLRVSRWLAQASTSAKSMLEPVNARCPSACPPSYRPNLRPPLSLLRKQDPNAVDATSIIASHLVRVRVGVTAKTVDNNV